MYEAGPINLFRQLARVDTYYGELSEEDDQFTVQQLKLTHKYRMQALDALSATAGAATITTGADVVHLVGRIGTLRLLADSWRMLAKHLRSTDMLEAMQVLALWANYDEDYDLPLEYRLSYHNKANTAQRINLPKLRHTVANHFPQLRIWPSDPDYFESSEEVLLRPVFGSCKLGGVLNTDLLKGDKQ